MEKKQITNSSTVSRQGSQGPTRGIGLGTSPVPGSLPHPPFSPTSVELPPQKGNKFITFLWPSHHLAGPPSGPQEEWELPLRAGRAQGDRW